MYLVLIETSGNQHYIFSTNKLRENVGASEWTWRAGTWFVVDAACSARKVDPPAWEDWTKRTAAALRTWLLDPKQNPPITDGSKAEVIVASSGKAYVLVSAEDVAGNIVAHVTKRALIEAPGLDVRGVVVPFRQDTEPIHKAVQRAHSTLEALRSTVPGPQSRFQRLPFVADCKTSGLPAMGWRIEGEGTHKRLVALSRVALSKREPALQTAAFKRMQHINPRIRATSIEDLEKHFESADRLAVIHADGNGLGQIFLSFHQHTDTHEAEHWRCYCDQLRLFSCALDVCTEEAFNLALADVFPEVLERSARGAGRSSDAVPIIPIVLGGDDLTILCAGRNAMAFAVAFLRRFEEQTSLPQPSPLDKVVPELTQKAFHTSRLSTCAGIAIVKPHFPFYAAYHLAEALLKSAKTVKAKMVGEHGHPAAVSSLDYHVLNDASGANLKEIRDRMQAIDSNVLPWCRPVIVTAPKAWGKLPEAAQQWAGRRTLARLAQRVLALRATDDDERRKLPTSLTHDLREAVFQTRAEADARLCVAWDRYHEHGLRELAADVANTDREHASLFWPEPGDDGQACHVTALVDAIEIDGFWLPTQEDLA